MPCGADVLVMLVGLRCSQGRVLCGSSKFGSWVNRLQPRTIRGAWLGWWPPAATADLLGVFVVWARRVLDDDVMDILAAAYANALPRECRSGCGPSPESPRIELEPSGSSLAKV